MKTTLILDGVRYTQYAAQEGQVIPLISVLENPEYVGKFLTLDELLYLERHFIQDFKSLFPPQGKILGGKISGRDHVCPSFWWNDKSVGINETLVKGVTLPGRKGYIHHLLIRKD